MSRYTGRTDTGAPIERTGWRDEDLKIFVDEYIGGIMPNDNRAISMWHREAMNWNCMAVDIDFMLLEHKYGKIAAAVEFKRMKARELSKNNNYSALMNLCENSNIPLFIVFYEKDFSRWTVCPTGKSRKSEGGDYEAKNYSEEGFVDFCYKLRGIKKIPTDVLVKLRSSKWKDRKKELYQDAACETMATFISTYIGTEGCESTIAYMVYPLKSYIDRHEGDSKYSKKVDIMKNCLEEIISEYDERKGYEGPVAEAKCCLLWPKELKAQ